MNRELYKAPGSNRFSSTNQPKNPTRKPSKLRKYIKLNNLDAYDISLIASNLINKTRKQLHEIAKDPNQPILISGSAAALLKDMSRGDTKTLIWLIERAFGKAQEYVHHSVTLGVYALSATERKKRIQELLEKAKDVNEEKLHDD